MHSRQQVRLDLQRSPIVEGAVGGKNPLYVERYLYKTIERTVSAMSRPMLLTQFGGARVREGDGGQWRSSNLPTQSMLMPAGVPTHWHYSGTIDFVLFYFGEGGSTTMQSLEALCVGRAEPMQLGDALVGALAMQVANELQKGRHADSGYMQRLVDVMLEQTFRALTTPSTGRINPRHAQFARLQAVLNYIHEHLADDLGSAMLADHAGVSLAHFRRIFDDAMGMPPHRYVVNARLEQARKLLTQTTLPIAHIADECGFSSQSHFTAAFKTAHAATPADYRSKLAAAGVAND